MFAISFLSSNEWLILRIRLIIFDSLEQTVLGVFYENSNLKHGSCRNPKLSLNRITIAAQKAFDFQVLLNPFKGNYQRVLPGKTLLASIRQFALASHLHKVRKKELSSIFCRLFS